MLNLPNVITLLRLALVGVFTIAICFTPESQVAYIIALASFVIAACTDWLDGYLARKLNQVTTFGKLIDPLADKITVSAAFIYLCAVGFFPIWICIVIIVREFLVTGIRQIAQDHGVIIAAGTSGKWKTAFQLAFCIGGLLSLTVQSFGSQAPYWLSTLSNWCGHNTPNNFCYIITLWAATILTIWSGLEYVYGARKFFK